MIAVWSPSPLFVAAPAATATRYPAVIAACQLCPFHAQAQTRTRCTTLNLSSTGFCDQVRTSYATATAVLLALSSLGKIKVTRRNGILHRSRKYFIDGEFLFGGILRSKEKQIMSGISYVRQGRFIVRKTHVGDIYCYCHQINVIVFASHTP